MRLSLRGKLTVIVGSAGLAFVVLMVTSALISERTEKYLASVQKRLLPKVEMGPRLEAQFERVRRSLQDAVAAYDVDALDATRKEKDEFMKQLAAAGDAIESGHADQLGRALEEYYAAAADVSRRLLSGETGEQLVGAMTDMQGKHTRTAALLKVATAFDRNELATAFSNMERAQAIASQVRLAISAACLTLVILLSIRLSRSVLGAVRLLTAGLRRFAVGEFGTPIGVMPGDELGQVAEQANLMAANLQRLAEERDRTDWLKNGHGGLLQELRGELEPKEAASRAIRFLAKTLDAPAGAVYYADTDRSLHLLGEYALSPAGTGAGAEATPSFRPGEGVVGEAALQNDITVLTDPPPNYLRVRSGLGEGSPRVVALVPILHAGRVSGMIELAFFSSWSSRANEFLLSIRETLAIAIEVARARAATRQLLAETQRQAQRLSTQEEELRANNEELQAQQEELKQTNEELTQQTEELAGPAPGAGGKKQRARRRPARPGAPRAGADHCERVQVAVSG